MGAGIVRDLVSDRGIVPIGTIVIGDVSGEKADALRQELCDPRLKAQQLDASDTPALHAALEGADLCINAVPTMAGFQMRIFEAALGARVPYLDLGGLGTFTVQQKYEHRRFRDAGVCAVLGAGSDPGMSNVLCRIVADALDTVEAINLYWAAELIGPENPVLVPPYSISTVLAEYALPSTQFYEGRHVEVGPMSGLEMIDLPEPWGRCEFIHSAHSEQLTVPFAAGIAEKGIREFTWKLHLPRREHDAWVGLVKAGFGPHDEPINIGGASIRPTEFLAAVMGRNITRNHDCIPHQESHEIHFAVARGTKDGAPATVRGQVIVRPNALYENYVDPATSMNGSIAAQLMLLADRKPGVWAPEEFFDPAAYVAELKKREFEVSLTVQRDVSALPLGRAAA
jgi:saccharopine dehydrogenase-like NADP-dependent oxidoreductase